MPFCSNIQYDILLIHRTWWGVFVYLFVVELLFHFYPDRKQIWTSDRYRRGKFNEGVIGGPSSLGTPGVNKC